MSDETKTYEFVANAKRYRITVPATYRCTYGQITPVGTKFNPGTGGNGYGLRFYENASKDTTRAIFTNVTEFRDVSIPLQVQAVRRFGTESWSEDDGSFHGKKAEDVEKSWRDVDDLSAGKTEGEGDAAPF